jgi:hypothetical protein
MAMTTFDYAIDIALIALVLLQIQVVSAATVKTHVNRIFAKSAYDHGLV